jgi:hypothetical protein
MAERMIFVPPGYKPCPVVLPDGRRCNKWARIPYPTCWKHRDNRDDYWDAPYGEDDENRDP